MVNYEVLVHEIEPGVPVRDEVILIFNFFELTGHSRTVVIFTQLCSKFPPTALLNFACDWLALDRDISFGRLTSPNV